MVWEQSRTIGVVRAVTKRAAQLGEGSVLASAAKSIVADGTTIVRRSYGYRWLTSEPDPATIVIDLRETRTVGPFVRLLQTVLEPFERACADSRLASVTTAVERSLSRSRTGRLLAALLEPPEPPENRDDGAE